MARTKAVADPLKGKAQNLRAAMRRRAPSLPAPSAPDILAWLQAQPMTCSYSGDRLTMATMSIDHKTPLERGGTNDFDNLCLCSKSANTSKGTMTEAEFRDLMALASTWDDGGKKLLSRLRMAGHVFGRSR